MSASTVPGAAAGPRAGADGRVRLPGDLPKAASDRAPEASTFPVRWGLSRHAHRLITLALAGLVIAVLTRRPEFAGAAAPAALLLLAWRPGQPDRIGLRVRLTTAQLVEGDEATAVVQLSGYGQHTVEMRIIPAESVIPGRPTGRPVAGGRSVGLPFRVDRWGRRSLGTLEVVLRDPWRLTEGRILTGLPLVTCSPRPAGQDDTIVLRQLPSHLGEHPSRRPGEGVEFAGIREFVPGDRQRRINWPATTRRGSLQLNTFAAEQAQNVVVIVDVSSDVGEPGSSSIDLAYRAAAGTIRVYLAARDRVGLILFGGRLSWIGLGAGQRHFRRMIDLMVASPGGFDRVPGLARLPKAALPPGSLIMVFSPLLDQRLVESLRDLRERGFTVFVVDVLNAAPPWQGRISELTRRIWRMEQEAIRFSLRQLGIPVTHWDGRQSVDEMLAPFTRRPR
jgi:uncharacterized protein (DUF58 family)